MQCIVYGAQLRCFGYSGMAAQSSTAGVYVQNVVVVCSFVVKTQVVGHWWQWLAITSGGIRKRNRIFPEGTLFMGSGHKSREDM